MNSYICISMYVRNTTCCYAYYEVLPMHIARSAHNERSRYGSNVHSRFQGWSECSLSFSRTTLVITNNDGMPPSLSAMRFFNTHAVWQQGPRTRTLPLSLFVVVVFVLYCRYFALATETFPLGNHRKWDGVLDLISILFAVKSKDWT